MGTVTFKKDQWVSAQGREGQIIRASNLKEVQLRDRNGELFTAPIIHLHPLDDAELAAQASRPVDSERELAAQREADFRLKAITPLLRLGPLRTREAVKARAAELQCDTATLYRWIKRYESTGQAQGLQRKPRSDARQSRTQPEVEVLMEALIDREYLQAERPAISGVYKTLLTEIRRANLSADGDQPSLQSPTYQTFRRRIHTISEMKRMSRRFGPEAARALRPILGHYPGATFPLAVVQIDHTRLDLALVDSITRQYIGPHAWITLVMDVFSRVVLGFHISLDAPSAFSVGMAVTHAILPKETWLARHRKTLNRLVQKLEPEQHPDLSWDFWGKPVKLKVDNAKEFWGKLLQKTCASYTIDQEFRPVHQPNYGGHIERLLGTVGDEIHAIPGTMFNNPGERGEYDSEGRAVMTIEGLETWLTAFLLGVYHHRVHSALGMTPTERWEQGIFEGTPEHPPTGIPERIMGERAERLRMDFLPYFEATVQRGSVRHDGLVYRGSALNGYTRAKHPDHPTQSRKFLFRYDPNDISQVYFLDPAWDHYHEIRCHQPDFPSMSLWQLRATKRFAKERQLKVDNERDLVAAWRLMQRIIQAERQETRQVRLDAERERRREKREKPTGAVKAASPSRTRAALGLFGDAADIQPFDELES
ncbi:Mu transposase C-terminal domain-containing protein [Deinococcus radiopugnans]|uniref:DDE-type integrase/transposase/recombinase n=1 Tax=Deinococcus radiopugnans ATCC 19172 TaxID=585398 RepID=A0A5C4YAC3_9DEIO|nr:DDE-type integrase/transposase/recombinase [Deinococcus radiopugnans ATCC 19172]